MNTNSRTKNSALNFLTNVVIQSIAFVTALVVRRVFIQSLGVEFLGINGLFNNILTILSLAELGIGTAMSYSMYKAVANVDKCKLAALNNYYRIMYNRIALIIVIIGVCLLPFLSHIVKLDRNIPHLHIYFILEVVNSAVSYLFVYKTTIVNADQSGYKLNVVGSFLQLLSSFLQVISLLILKKYMVFLLIGIGITFVNNMVKSYYAEKWYPFIKDKTKVLPEKEKKEIWNNIKAMFAYKMGGVILNNTDNIIISVIINTVSVGLFSNYMMLSNKMHGIIAMLFGSIYSSIGNLNITGTLNKKKSIFNLVCFLSFWLYSLGTIGFFFCGNDIVKAISGSESFVLDNSVLIACVVLFYLNVPKQPVLLFRETTGLFKYGKYSIIASSILNILLSIVLGKIYGLFGIILATSVSRLLCDIWYEPFVLFKKIFKESSKGYFVNQLKFALVTLLSIIILYPIINSLNINHLYIKLFVEAGICFLLTNLIFLICYRKTEEYLYIKEKALYMIKKLLNNNVEE